MQEVELAEPQHGEYPEYMEESLKYVPVLMAHHPHVEVHYIHLKLYEVLLL